MSYRDLVTLQPRTITGKRRKHYNNNIVENFIIFNFIRFLLSAHFHKNFHFHLAFNNSKEIMKTKILEEKEKL